MSRNEGVPFRYQFGAGAVAGISEVRMELRGCGWLANIVVDIGDVSSWK
jgi:hypothetical protein